MSGGLAVYTIGSGGALNAISGSPFAAGNGAYSVVFDKTGASSTWRTAQGQYDFGILRSARREC